MGRKKQEDQSIGSPIGTSDVDLHPKDKQALTDALTTGGMTRRQAIKWLSAMGISAISASSLITPFAKSAFASTATPKRGGRLRFAVSMASIKDTLDPAHFSYVGDYSRGFMFYNGLTRIDTNTIAQPELAESFEPNADATEWVFKLRKGVTFHDGTIMDADDVVYSLLRHKDPKIGSNAKSLADLLDTVTADGKDTVRIKLTGPNGDLPILLGTFYFMIVKKGTTDFTTANGTGPFKVKEFKPGIRTLGERNDNYFLSGRPYLDEIELIGIADNSARLNSVFSGEFHMNDSIPLSSVEDVKKRDGVEIFATQCPRFTHFVMMVDRPPFNNPDMRKAMKYLLNREKALKSLMKNYGQLGNDHPFAPQDIYYNNSLPQRGQDLEKAKYHLKKAGMEKAKLDLHVSDAAYMSIELGMMLQREASRVGLTVNLKREPTDGYWSNVWRKRSFHAAEWNARPTNDLLLSIGFSSNAKWNESQYKNEQVDKLITQGRAESNFDTRKDIYWELQEILNEDGANLVPCFIDSICVITSNVKGLVTRITGGLGGYNFADSVWLDS